MGVVYFWGRGSGVKGRETRHKADEWRCASFCVIMETALKTLPPPVLVVQLA